MCSKQSAPAYLVRDKDGAYGHVFKSRVRAMGIRDRSQLAVFLHDKHSRTADPLGNSASKNGAVRCCCACYVPRLAC